MEAGVSIWNFNREEYVFLGLASQTVPTSTGFRIFINKSLHIEVAKYAYVHELSNARNIDNIKLAFEFARNNPKNSSNRLTFARALAYEEAKGVISQITFAIKISDLQNLSNKFPSNIISAVQSYNEIAPTVSQSEFAVLRNNLINLCSNWIETDFENAIDESGNPIFQGYLDTYDAS